MGYIVAQNGALAVDEEKAVTVRRVFELKVLYPNASLQKLADLLNSEGKVTARGSRFHKNSVKRILDREALYLGRYRYAGIEALGQHQSIL